MKHSPADRITLKRQTLVTRTAKVLDIDIDEAVKLLCISRSQSIRINTLKPKEMILNELRTLGWKGSRYRWINDGLTVNDGLTAIRDSDNANEGYVYIQNAASWIPVLVLDAKPGDMVLDMCAAPGGKTSHIAAQSGNQAFITANDNSRTRLSKLQKNMQRLGVHNISYTLFDATRLATKIEGQTFDKILLDAPCSGEGMMSYSNDKDFATWSVAHIKRLQTLQKKLILQAWILLKPGGTLVYSTCTMSPEENEAIIDYLLRKRDNVNIGSITLDLPNRVQPVLAWNDKGYDKRISKSLRLKPSESIEAFFVCKLIKTHSL